ncbi:hypothetical protein [Lactiplantibacillus songbeiensis]|uniref:Integral membrane protein n=1 Tax=Lactiplantibacillus songbeiensis TaxID=2559920 RepID=A0ABW4C1E2_9LACO|nr:hypothetical protein [Lactiplantibacillus songbeiensis]
MQVAGQFLATIGWLGLALIVSELVATGIYLAGQWLGYRLSGSQVVLVAGFRYQIARVTGHWHWQRPLTSYPHLVALPPTDAKRFNYASICFSGGLFSLLTVIISLVTVAQVTVTFNLWLMVAVIWIWVNTLKAGQLLPMMLHGRPTGALDFKTARTSSAALTAAYVTQLAAATTVMTGSVASLPVDAILMPTGGDRQNYLVVRQAWVTLQWGLQHSLSLPDLLTGLDRLAPSFNTLPPADLAIYVDATIYWNLIANRTGAQIIGWYQDTGLQRLRQRYTPLTQYKLQAAYTWRVDHQEAQALALIDRGLIQAKRVAAMTEVEWLKALRTKIQTSGKD